MLKKKYIPQKYFEQRLSQTCQVTPEEMREQGTSRASPSTKIANEQEKNYHKQLSELEKLLKRSAAAN